MPFSPVIWRSSALVFAGALLAFQAPLAAHANDTEMARKALLLDVLELESGTLLSAGERGHILRSTDAGKSWQLTVTPSDVLLTTLTSFGSTALAGGHQNSILRSTDDGVSWSKVFDTGKLPEDDAALDSPVLDLACMAPPACEAVGGYGLWLRSADGGATWERRYIKEGERHAYALLPVQAGFLVATEEGGLMRHETALDDWTALTPPAGGSLFGLVRDSQNTLMAYGLSGRIITSRDEGSTWEPLNTGIDSGLLGATTLKDGTTLFVGASGTLLTWNPLSGDFLLQQRNNRKTFSTALQSRNGTVWLVGETGLSRREDANADK